MRYKLKAPVSSTGRLEAETEIQTDAYFMRLIADEEGYLSRIELEMDAPDYEECLSRCAPLPEGSDAPFSISIDTDHRYHQKLVSILQYYESVGSFGLAIVELDWQGVGFEWLPDNEQERASLTVLGCGEIREWYKLDIPIANSMICKLVALQSDLQHLVYPMSFFREGNRYFSQLRYIAAFNHFYYYLENIYGDGKWKPKEIVPAFLSSAQLMEATEVTWGRIQDDQFHGPKLSRLMMQHRCPMSAEGLVRLFVLMRGKLHHANAQRKPFLDLHGEREYQSLAYACMSVCTLSFANAFDVAWEGKQMEGCPLRFERGVPKREV